MEEGHFEFKIFALILLFNFDQGSVLFDLFSVFFHFFKIMFLFRTRFEKENRFFRVNVFSSFKLIQLFHKFVYYYCQ